MGYRSVDPAAAPSGSLSSQLPTRVAIWLLDSQHLGHAPGIKRIAGRLLKQPAREGVVAAQSRLGQLLCRDCDGTRDRRIGVHMLRQAARAGDRLAQLELERAAERGVPEACQVLGRPSDH